MSQIVLMINVYFESKFEVIFTWNSIELLFDLSNQLNILHHTKVVPPPHLQGALHRAGTTEKTHGGILQSVQFHLIFFLHFFMRDLCLQIRPSHDTDKG